MSVSIETNFSGAATIAYYGKTGTPKAGVGRSNRLGRAKIAQESRGWIFSPTPFLFRTETVRKTGSESRQQLRLSLVLFSPRRQGDTLLM